MSVTITRRLTLEFQRKTFLSLPIEDSQDFRELLAEKMLWENSICFSTQMILLGLATKTYLPRFTTAVWFSPPISQGSSKRDLSNFPNFEEVEMARVLQFSQPWTNKAPLINQFRKVKPTYRKTVGFPNVNDHRQSQNGQNPSPITFHLSNFLLQR